MARDIAEFRFDMFVSICYVRVFRVCRGNRSRKQLKQESSARIVVPLLALLRVAMSVIHFAMVLKHVVVDDIALIHV